ncbi:MAG TPA: DinB family protein [Usitatibacter sp.]|nr:DinB family protein [Usitatibacter sp.]
MPPRLGLAESIERLDAMPEFLEAAIDAAGHPENLLFQPAPGGFSLVEHACHLRDLEREGYLVRVRRMAAENAPVLESFDGAAVAAARDYRGEDARIAAQEFGAARRELLGMLAPLTEEDMARQGTFDGEPVSFGDVIAMMVEHDRGHREEIENLIDRLEER